MDTELDQDGRPANGYGRVGAFMQEAREELGRTQREVEAELGLGERTLSSYETGRVDFKRGVTKHYRRYATYLGWGENPLPAIATIVAGGHPPDVVSAPAAAIAGGPLTEAERAAGVLAVNESRLLSDETKARVIEWLRARPEPVEDSNDAAG